MSATSTLHITPEGDAWAVRLDEAAAPSSIHPTRGLAVASIFETLRDRDEAEVLVHDPDGRVSGSLLLRRFTPLREMAHSKSDFDVAASPLEDDDEDDPAARAEALRITPGNERLRAMIGKFPLPPGDYDAEELPC